MRSDRFKFRRHSTIGAAAAEEDGTFLQACFLDTGDLDTLLSTKDPKRVVLGRTGVGKSALLAKVQETEHAIVVNPESLSFNFLANSSILQFFLEAGVKLDLFFKLLWRHVFTVELLKARYGITNEATKRSFIERIQSVIIKDKKKERAVKYLLQWGDKFWEPTEYRIKEITTKIEDQLTARIGMDVAPLTFQVGGAAQLSEEKRGEVVQRGQAVINDIQMRELTDVLDFLNDDVFDDPQKKYYVCIDRLDENWIEEKFRYLMIRSLIETVRDFLRVTNIKIIVVLRTDLLERVFRLTRDPGFQEEKYRSLFLRLRWSPEQLTELLNMRVNFLVQQTYTTHPVLAKDLLPKGSIDGMDALDYMIERTLYRPRELIEFFNLCIEGAEGKTTILKPVLVRAEGEYSKRRLRSLQDEWLADFPTLIEFTNLIKGGRRRFRLNILDTERTQDEVLNYVIENQQAEDLLSKQARALVDGLISREAFIGAVAHVMYRVGLLGLKVEAQEPMSWSSDGLSSVTASKIGLDTSAEVHPMFWRALGIRV